MKYLSGEPRTDGAENSEVFFARLEDARNYPDITDFSRLILSSLDKPGLHPGNYCSAKSTPDKYRVYGL